MGYIYNKFISSLEKNNSITDYKVIKNKNDVNNMFFKDLYSSYTELISDVIIYVILVCNILTILFFTLIKDIEGEIVKQQINNLLDDIFSNIKTNDNSGNSDNSNKLNNFIISNTNNDIQAQNILNKFNNIKNNLKVEMTKKIENISSDIESEKKIKENNEMIFKKSMTFLAIVNILCLIVLFLLWNYKKFDIIYYIKKNFILGIFVILTELIFLYIISKNYIYIDKKYVIMETIKKISK